jgi:predicted GNAT family N-acyltransferase
MLIGVINKMQFMSISISRVNWEHAAPLLKTVREKVFICEWRIPKTIEFDQYDKNAIHMLVCCDQSQEPIATGRILPSGEISRIAVLSDFRKKQIDKVILKGLIRIAKDLELQQIYISSPLDSVEYFKRRHFEPAGSVFMVAGRPRQKMSCPINSISTAKYYLSH